ncbi:hypothetical protein [Ralstonia phage RpT1]|nr:hypothetical protein [Ralstonia phage RpT1]
MYYLLSYDEVQQSNHARWVVKRYEEYADIASSLDRAGELLANGKAVHIEPLSR